MPRLMSVAMTKEQVYDRSKTVTRRLGWRFAKPGDRYTLCEKVQGRQGKPLVRIVDVEVLEAWREPLMALLDPDLYAYPDYGRQEVAWEGFPGMSPREFVNRFFVEAQGMALGEHVTRIRWRYLGPVDDTANPDRQAAVLALGLSAAKAAADFTRSMRQVSEAIGTTSGSLERLRERAKQEGATTFDR